MAENKYVRFEPAAPQKVAQKPAPAQQYVRFEPESSTDKNLQTLSDVYQGAEDTASTMLSAAITPFAWAGEQFDKVAGAPTRAGLMETVKTGDLWKGTQAAGEQLSKFDSRSAPSGKDIAKELGFSETSMSDVAPNAYDEEGRGFRLKKGGLLDPSASGAAGLGIEMGADLGNVLPLAAGAKLALGGAKQAGKGLIRGAQAVGRGARNFADIASGEIKAGTAIQNAGKSVVTPVKKIANLFSNEIAPTFARAAQVASENGIDPELLSDNVRFGAKKGLSRLRRRINEGAMGEDLIEAHREGARQIAKAIEGKANKISGIQFYDDAEAGSHLTESLRNARDKLVGTDDLTYRRVLDYAPGLYVNSESQKGLDAFLNGLESRGKGLERRGLLDQPSVGRDMQGIVAAVRKNYQGGRVSYKRLLDQMQYVGNAAFKDAPVLGKMPVDKKELQNLYFKMREALLDTVKRDVNPDFAKEVMANNEKVTRFLDNQKKLSAAFDENKAPEQVLKHLVYGTDSVKSSALKEILSENPDALNAMKSAYIKKIIGTPNEEGVLSFKRIASNLEREKTRLGMFLDRSEIEDLKELVKLGEDHGYDVLSFSGTGASSAFGNVSSATGLLKEAALRKGYDLAKKGGSNIPASSITIPGGVKTATDAAKAGLIGAPAGRSLLDEAKRLSLHPIKSRTSLDRGLKRMQMIDSIDKRRGEEK